MLRAALVLALLLATPAAAAARLDAALATDAPVSWEGASTLRGAFAWRAEGPVEVSWSDARGNAYAVAWDHHGREGARVTSSTPDRANDSFVWDAGAARVTCEAACVILALGDDCGAATLDARGAGAWSRLDARVLHHSGVPGSASDNFHYEAPEGFWATDVEDATARGCLVLYLQNATLIGEQGSLDTRATREPLTGPLGVPLGERTTVRFAVLKLRDAEILASAGPAYAEAPQIDLDGTLRADDVAGYVRVDGKRRDLTSSSVDADGAFRLALAAAPGALAADDAPDLLAGGEATRVRIDGREQTFVAPGTVAAGVGLVALAAALLAAWPLYSRLKRADLLGNPNRQRILDTLRGGGASPANLQAQTGLAEPVLRYHLDMLMQHGFVRTLRVGKRRLFFESGARGAPETDALLQDPTRRRVWEIARAEGPLTTADLARRAGISGRLARYHVAKLGDAGLVHREANFVTVPEEPRPLDPR